MPPVMLRRAADLAGLLAADGLLGCTGDEFGRSSTLGSADDPLVSADCIAHHSASVRCLLVPRAAPALVHTGFGDLHFLQKAGHRHCVAAFEGPPEDAVTILGLARREMRCCSVAHVF